MPAGSVPANVANRRWMNALALHAKTVKIVKTFSLDSDVDGEEGEENLNFA
jgi:hypothetical protein